MTVDEFLAEWQNDEPTVLVHTSGSTGQPKALRVEKRRMEASARMTCRFLGLQSGDVALLCLPVDYIAGKMMVVRAQTCGLRLIAVEPDGHPLSGVANDGIQFAAMVPLQVYNSLQVPEERERLMRIRHLIIGGGAVDESLAEALKDFPHNVWSTYGMTETLSHVALRRLNGPGRSQWYTPMEGIDISLSAEGCLVVDAPALCAERLVTNDIAEIAPQGSLFRILGRRDNVICSGGLKLQIEALEARLRPHIPVPFLVTKRKDVVLGEAAVLLVEAPDAGRWREVCRRVLSPYEQPRYYVSVDRIPLTATGKPARAEAQRLAR
ncbi:MAG: AMP-binding protein [Prevotella sp.]|nr:AMP-binding protein [Prevotella sp.]